jgi:small-conductance mechanosensitive channel
MDDLLREGGKFFTNPWVTKFVIAFVGLIIIRALIFVLQRSFSRYITDSQTRYRVRKLVTFFGYFFVIFFLAIVFKDRLGGLTVVLGVTGAGMAFALQEVIVSVAGWVAIVFGNFYSTGDRVQLGGIKGDVIDIGVLRTTLMECGEWIKADQFTGRIVRIANSFVFKEPVFNYSTDFPFLWDELTVPVTHQSDYRLARDILSQVLQEVVGDYADYAKKSWHVIARKYMVEEAMLEPAVTLAFNDNWIEFTLRYVVDYRGRRGTKNQIFLRILEEFAKIHDRVAIASTTMQLVEAAPAAAKPRLNE